ncbi:MAG: glycerate kinase [Candidatus Bathyarchaeota archaeon]|nr:glycerate kinase [Candidatus Bathyarchaeota archaeon]
MPIHSFITVVEKHIVLEAMPKINNKKTLIENARSRVNRRARRIALTALEGALSAVDPKRIIKSRIILKRNRLRVQDREFDLSNFRKIFIVGGGKASGKMAEALEEILCNRISAGIVNVPYKETHILSQVKTAESPGSSSRIGTIKLHQASHPIPDKAGLEGTKRILELASRAGKDDLIFCLISGGGSSLMPLPRGKISLDDKRLITESLLKSGATINEVNTVRKHISDFKGGMLAKAAYPATIVNVILSDVIGDPLDFIASGPTVPDSTTFRNAIEILKRYRLWETLLKPIKTVLTKGDRGILPETPKKGDKVFRKVHNFVIGNNRLASLATCKELEKQDLAPLLLTSYMEGEAKHVGIMLGSIAREILKSEHPLPKPCGIVAGGETTVTVIGDGKGGRSQELVLAAALKISGLKGAVVASLSTDGVDGPTPAAGALADGETVSRSLGQKLDPRSLLANNDSYNFFSRMDDLILTGPTETNVNDIALIVVV